MAQSAGTFSTYDAVGNREDLANKIFNVFPHEVPLISMIPKTTATGTYHEWQTDTLAAPSGSNAAIEGNEYTGGSISPTERKGNRTQILTKEAVVTGTQEKADKAGRTSEMAYQLAKKGKEIRNDLEVSLFANNAAVAGNDSTGREMGGLEAWYETNVSRGTGGASGSDGTTAATDGTQRAFNESLLKSVLASQFDNSGESADCIFLSAYNKQVFSTFTGNSTRFDKADDAILNTVVDIYVSDFGRLKVVPARHTRSRTAHILNSDMVALAAYRSFYSEEVAKIGDAERRAIVGEYTLEVRNEASLGVIADLTTS